MAITISNPVPAGFTFNEVAGNNGAIANSLTLKIAGGTFAGDNGDLVGAEITNVPAGLTAVLVKTSATTAKLTLTGTATAHADAQDITNLTVTFADENFATGGTAPAAINNLAVNFNDPAAAKTLTLVAPAGAGTSETYKADNLPTITGTLPDGVDKVYIYNNGGTKPIGTATITGNTWSFKLPTEKLKDGAYSLTASASNDGKGAMTAGFAFTVDQKAPSAPSVTAIKGAISDVTPVLTGKAEKFATVKVYSSETQTDPVFDEDGITVTNPTAVTLLGTTQADAKGVWTLQVEDPALLGAGDATYKITAKAIDAAGNETKSKKAVDLTIDTTIATPTLTATTVAKKNTVALTGKVEGETGGTLQLYGGEDGSLALGKAIKIGKDGTWKSSVKLTDGKHLLSVVAVDAAGNVSDNSVIKEVTIDTFTATPTLELDKDGSGNVIGVKGTAEAGATVKITIGKKTLEAKAEADGTWSQTFTGFTPDSTTKAQTIKAVATDTATNVSKPSVAVTHTFTEAAGGGGDSTFTVTATNGELTFGGTAAGDITVTESDGTLTFARGGVEATNTATLADLKAASLKAPGTDDLAMTTAVFDAIKAKLAADVAVTLNDTAGIIAATVLSAIGGATTGTVTVANNQTITGTSAEVMAALATAATDTKVVMATDKVATVDLADGAQSFTATQLTSVYGAPGGTVIGTTADTITVTTLANKKVAATESIDTFVFNVGDTSVNITDFTFGAGGDKLNVSTFIGATLAARLNVQTSASIDASNLNVLGLTNLGTPIANNFGDTADSSTIKTAANQKLFLVADDVNDSQLFQSLYYVTTDASNVATVTLVGAINQSGDTLHEENFITTV